MNVMNNLQGHSQDKSNCTEIHLPVHKHRKGFRTNDIQLIFLCIWYKKFTEATLFSQLMLKLHHQFMFDSRNGKQKMQVKIIFITFHIITSHTVASRSSLGCHHCHKFFIIDLAISVNVCFSDHFVYFLIC